MATPTDEQQVRATLRRHAKREGDGDAASLALRCAEDIVGRACLLDAINAAALGPSLDELPMPEIMGAQEAAAILHMDPTNLKRLSPPLPVETVISGRYPVYRASEVEKTRRRRLEQGRLRGAQPALDGAS